MLLELGFRLDMIKTYLQAKMRYVGQTVRKQVVLIDRQTDGLKTSTFHM